MSSGTLAQSAADTLPVLGQSGNTVSVTGEGAVAGQPDVLRLAAGAQAFRKSPSDALNTVSADIDRMIQAVTARGVATQDIQTTGINLGPHYPYGSSQQPDGYNASNSVVVKVRQLTRAGEIIGAVAAAGGNDAVISGVSFDFADNAKLLSAARAAAIADSQQRATAYATQAGRRLGRVLSITETYSPSPTAGYGMGAGGAAAGSATVPIQPGVSSVAVRVAVVFELD